MRQRAWGVAIAALLGLLVQPAAAAEVAIVKSADAAGWKPALDALRAGIGSHTVTENDLAGNRAVGEQLLAGMKGRRVILVALGPLAAQVCHEAAGEQPLVYAMVPDPAAVGLGDASNATGVAFSVPVKNQLAAFRMVNPRGVKIGVIYNPAIVQAQVQDAQKAAAVVRLQILDRPVTSERDVPEALRDILKEADALWIPADPTLLANEQTRHFIMSETLKKAIPVYGFSPALVTEGALVSNGASMQSIGQQLAELVNRIAGGESPGNLGLRVPAAELVINKKIADKLKIEIPADALRSASKVY